MRLNVRAMTIASGIVMAVLFSICALAIAVSPMSFMASVSYMTHIDLTGLSRTITWASYYAGLVCWTALAMIVTAAMTGLYNRLAWPMGRQADVTLTRREHPEMAMHEPRPRI